MLEIWFLKVLNVSLQVSANLVFLEIVKIRKLS